MTEVLRIKISPRAIAMLEEYVPLVTPGDMVQHLEWMEELHDECRLPLVQLVDQSGTMLPIEYGFTMCKLTAVYGYQKAINAI